MGVLNGWFLVTIVVPLISPPIGLLVLRLLPLHDPTTKVMTTVKDGQLGWAVIAMGASAIYELWEAEEAHKVIPLAGWILAGLIGVMLASTLVAAGGAAVSTPLLTKTNSGVKPWAMHYKLFIFSVVMAAGTALLYARVHFSTSP